MAGNTNLKEDDQLKWAFKNSLFSQTSQTRPSFRRVIFWAEIRASPILQIKKYWKSAGKVYYLGFYLKRESQFLTVYVNPFSVLGRQTCWFENSPVTPFPPPDSLETHDFSALGAPLLTPLVFASFKWMSLHGYFLHVAWMTFSHLGSTYSETDFFCS